MSRPDIVAVLKWHDEVYVPYVKEVAEGLDLEYERVEFPEHFPYGIDRSVMNFVAEAGRLPYDPEEVDARENGDWKMWLTSRNYPLPECLQKSVPDCIKDAAEDMTEEEASQYLVETLVEYLANYGDSYGLARLCGTDQTGRVDETHKNKLRSALTALGMAAQAEEYLS